MGLIWLQLTRHHPWDQLKVEKHLELKQWIKWHTYYYTLQPGEDIQL